MIEYKYKYDISISNSVPRFLHLKPCKVQRFATVIYLLERVAGVDVCWLACRVGEYNKVWEWEKIKHLVPVELHIY